MRLITILEANENEAQGRKVTGSRRHFRGGKAHVSLTFPTERTEFSDREIHATILEFAVLLHFIC